MRKSLFLFLLIFVCFGIAQAQITKTDPVYVLTDPVGSACAPNRQYNNVVNGHILVRVGGVCTRVDGTGGVATETDPVVKAINGIVKSNTVTIGAATPGTDYLTPTGSAAGLTSFPTLNQNTTGTASNVSGTPALPNGTTATTQSQADGSTKLATDAYVDTGLATKQNSLGFTAENVANKENTTIDSSTTKYPTVNLLNAGLGLKLNLSGGTVTGQVTQTITVTPGAGTGQYGVSSSVGEGSGNTGTGFYSINGLSGVATSATTVTTATAHPNLNGLLGNANYTGVSPGRVDVAAGAQTIAQNNGTGTIGDAYGGIFQSVSNSGTISNGWGAIGDVAATSTGVFGAASAVRARMRNLGSGTQASFKGVDLSGWANSGGGSVTTSCGICADTSIDIGTTHWFINSSSTSPSQLGGELRLNNGILTATHATAPSSPAANNLSLFFNSANSDHLSVKNSSGTVTDLQAGGGITNSAGNNVVPKSNGTNLVASQINDNGITWGSSSTSFRDDNSTAVINRTGASVAAIDLGNLVANTVEIGDVDGNGNGTTLTVDDSSSTVTTSGNSVLNGDVLIGGNISGNSTKSVGTNGAPFGSFYVGNAAPNNIQITGTATAARVATFPDSTGTVQLVGAANTGTILPVDMSNGVLSTATGTVYASPGTTAGLTNATESAVSFPVTRAGTIRNLYVRTGGTAKVNTPTTTIVVRKNGVDTTLTLVMTQTTSTTSSDTTHSFTVVAGDLITLSFTTTGTAGVSTSIAGVSFEID